MYVKAFSLSSLFTSRGHWQTGINNQIYEINYH